MRRLAIATAASLVLTAIAFAGVVTSEIDDFDDGTTEGWVHPVPTGLVVNIADGGPAGAGDNFLQVTSTGTTGPGSRMAVVNERSGQETTRRSDQQSRSR